MFLGGHDALTPTFRNVNNKFSVKYFLNLVLIDEEDRRRAPRVVCTLVYRMPLQGYWRNLPRLSLPGTSSSRRSHSSGNSELPRVAVDLAGRDVHHAGNSVVPKRVAFDRVAAAVHGTAGELVLVCCTRCMAGHEGLVGCSSSAFQVRIDSGLTLPRPCALVSRRV